MSEPIAPAIAAAAIAAPATAAVLTVAGIPTGLLADHLLAGFLGALAAIALLDSVPSTGDTLRELLATSLRRVGVAIGSAVTAGYCGPFLILTPGLLGLHVAPEARLFVTFIVGAGAQRILRALVDRTANRVRGDVPPAPPAVVPPQ